jgi:hypothetical protein
MRKYFHFTITTDAKRQIPKMILERLADEYLWQWEEYTKGATSVKERAQRITELINAEIKRRSAEKEFERMVSVVKTEQRTG